jgi:hypothetical protein
MALTNATRAKWPEWEKDIPLYELEHDGRLRGTSLVYTSAAGISKESNS